MDLHESEAAVHRVFAHPLRARILARMHYEQISPKELAQELGASIGVVSYHIRILCQAGLVELVATAQRRGTIQHYYRARDTNPTVVDVAVRADRYDWFLDRLQELADEARKETESQGEGAEPTMRLTLVAHRPTTNSTSKTTQR
jgi:DNA-binding transcriptional ArsR family regulator